jgi:hypothetical protein
MPPPRSLPPTAAPATRPARSAPAASTATPGTPGSSASSAARPEKTNGKNLATHAGLVASGRLSLAAASPRVREKTNEPFTALSLREARRKAVVTIKAAVSA